MDSTPVASTIAALQSIATLRELGSSMIGKLADVGAVQNFVAGTVLFSEGELHNQLYFVCNGSVRLDMITLACGRQTILSVGSGDLLAWSSLIGDSKMTATAVTMEDTAAVIFRADELKRTLDSDASLGYQVMKTVAQAMSRRLLATRLQLLDLYHHEEALPRTSL